MSTARPRLRLVTRFGATGSPLPAFMVGSMGAHVLAVLAMLWVPALRPAPQMAQDFLTVDLSGALPAAPVAAAPELTTAPPPAAQDEAPPEQGVRVEPEEPSRIEKPKPAKKPTTPPVRQPVVSSANPARPVQTGTAVDPLASATEGASSSIVMEGGDAEFAWYRASVTAALYSHWQRPVLSGVADAVEVAVSFEIQRDGSVRGLRLDSPSRIPSLDRSALRAVSDAAPLAPLPSSWRTPTLPARFTFRLHPEDY